MLDLLSVNPKICLMGASLGTGNRGVSALSAALVGLVRLSAPQAVPVLLIGHRSSEAFKLQSENRQVTEVEVVNYRKSVSAPLDQQLWWICVLAFVFRFFPAFREQVLKRNRWVRTVATSLWVGDIRGGDSFSDIYGFRRFVVGCLPVLAVLSINPNFLLFPQTYGPFKSRASQMVAAFILRRAKYIISRDHDSIALAERLARKRVLFSPDVAFTLPSIRPQDDGIFPPISRKSGVQLVGINVNGLMFNGGYTGRNMFGLTLNYKRFLTLFIHRLLSETDADLLFVPHTFAPPNSVESDPEACRAVISQFKRDFSNRLHLVEAPHNQSEIKWIIGQCNFFVGSRMHACIAALSQAIPAIGVAYSKKFQGVFNSVGVGEWVIDARVLTEDQAVLRAFELFDQRFQMRKRLADSIPSAQGRIHEVFRSVFNGENYSNGEAENASESNGAVSRG